MDKELSLTTEQVDMIYRALAFLKYTINELEEWAGDPMKKRR